MAKIIELSGSPGVGKSTLYNALKAKWKKEYNWLPAEQLYPKQIIRYDNLKAFLLTLAKKLNGGIDAVPMQAAGDRFIAAYPDFMNAMWENICFSSKLVHNGKDVRFHNAAFYYRHIQKMQFLKEFNNKNFILKDEGIIHRIPHQLYKSLSMEEEKKEMAKLIPKLPLSNALIYVSCDVKENVKRLISRKYVWPGHKNLSKDELELWARETNERREIVLEILESLKVPILRIDSAQNINSNVSRTLKFISTIVCNVLNILSFQVLIYG